MDKRISAVFCAVLAAVFYAVNMPVSKTLLANTAPTVMAALLYLGAGLGVGLLYLLGAGRTAAAEDGRLTREDLPYTLGMIALDTLAPICLMCGLAHTTAASASLLNNFEIAATSLIALLVFREAISKRLWLAIALVTLSGCLLSLEDASSLTFSRGSLLVLLAAVCWGLENNCTRKIASKNTFVIVTLKGLGSGTGSLVISRVIGEPLPGVREIVPALLLGFVAYGLSIFFYIRAQDTLGAAKTSAYYALAPFVGAFLSFVFLHEPLTRRYLLALLIMAAGSAVLAADTLAVSHTHAHTHTVTHTHDGVTHSHRITHTHPHSHLFRTDVHRHVHRAPGLHR